MDSLEHLRSCIIMANNIPSLIRYHFDAALKAKISGRTRSEEWAKNEVRRYRALEEDLKDQTLEPLYHFWEKL